MDAGRLGLWLVGARGGVASAAILGLAALRQPATGKGVVGLVSELPQFEGLELRDWRQFVVAGHEIRNVSLAEECARLAREARHAPLVELAGRCLGELEAVDRRIRPGTVLGAGRTIASLADLKLPADETPRQAIERLRRDLAAFRRAEEIDHLVVVHVASTEPPADVSRLPTSWKGLEELIAGARPGQDAGLPASSLYAIAALEEGASYVNFTPSLGSGAPAIDELARLRGARHYGCDGKTGETLVKSVLAPMFARRNLEVMSWVGHNIFGNLDGRVLDDPANKRTKVASKDRLIREILGYAPRTLVSIEYVPDLGDWKTAWDHVHFAGFLGVPMTLQFTWQGCDSLLAAPLVLDLARFADLARRRGHVGAMPFLAGFFKSPLGVAEHGFERQFEMLERWATNH